MKISLRTKKLFTTVLLFAFIVILGMAGITYAQGVSPGQPDEIANAPNNTLNLITNLLLIPLISVLTTFLIALIRKKTLDIEQSIKEKRLSKYINRAEDAICTAVAAISQTYVDTLKKTSAFTSIEQQKAFGMAKQRALTIMGKATLEALQDALGDGDVYAWINNKIEYYVKYNK
jgi:Na+/phosphate symporter